KNKEKVLLLPPYRSGKNTLLNVLNRIVPNLIKLPIKYDQFNIHHHTPLIFQHPHNQFSMPKLYQELPFLLQNTNIPTTDMHQQIQHPLNSLHLNLTHKT
ncbi:P-loop NTPase family protein, partial [Staphylococcus epidermidis]